jgi:hypothetical protein
MDTRIWCEFTSPKEVCKDYVLELFKKNNITLNYKLEYGNDNDDFFSMIQTYNEHHIPISIWATLSDEMGYWINEKNAHYFEEYAEELIDKFEERELAIKGLCIDLESPLSDIKKIVSPKRKIDSVATCAKFLTHNLSKRRFNTAKETLKNTVDNLKSRGYETYATCLRYCYYDLKFNTEVMQNALEVPVFDIDWDKCNMMYYATLIRKELKILKNVNIDYLIYHQVLHLKEKLRDRLAISVGVTNVGKLGNEPYYESMEEFEKDIGILKECGVEDFSLFSLDGIMEEKKLEAFLTTMHKAKPCKPELCSKVIRNEVLLEMLLKVLNSYYKLYR